jgi:hypothetical protein
VNVVRHQDERIGGDIGEMLRNRVPAAVDAQARPIAAHFTGDDFPEQVAVVERADGEEVSLGLGIVEPGKPHATTLREVHSGLVVSGGERLQDSVATGAAGPASGFARTSCPAPMGVDARVTPVYRPLLRASTAYPVLASRMKSSGMEPDS